MTRNVVLGITGASGAIYAVRLVEVLLAAGYELHLVISSAGKAVLKQELDVDVDLDRFSIEQLLTPAAVSSSGAKLLQAVVADERGELPQLARLASRVKYHAAGDLMAPIASGSFLTAGMVVCPCSGSTLSAIAHAGATNLIQRAAEVHLKERRKLVLVPRETPLSSLQIENMRRVAEAGAVVLPAMPGWYHGVTSLRDLVDFVVGRICDQLGVEQNLIRRWGESEGRK